MLLSPVNALLIVTTGIGTFFGGLHCALLALAPVHTFVSVMWPVFVTWPAFASDCLTTYVPIKVQVAPGATVAHGVVPPVGTNPASGSLTTTFCKVTLPVFVAVIVNVSVSPTST